MGQQGAGGLGGIPGGFPARCASRESSPRAGRGWGANNRPSDSGHARDTGGRPWRAERLGRRAFSFDWLGHSRLGWAADSIIVTSHRDADHPPWRGYVYLKKGFDDKGSDASQQKAKHPLNHLDFCFKTNLKGFQIILGRQFLKLVGEFQGIESDRAHDRSLTYPNFFANSSIRTPDTIDDACAYCLH